MSNHPIVHIEIPAKDPIAAGKFYKALLDWDVSEQPELDYVTFRSGDGQGGGFPRIDGELYKPGDVIAYVDTDNIDAVLARVEAMGGKTLVPKSEIPGYGWFAHFADPSGNRIGLFTNSRSTAT